MNKQFDGVFGNRVRCIAAASKTILRQSLWLMLFLLGWASTAQAAIPAAERQVLLDLYASTNGASWTDKTGWNGGIGTECTWHGVECDGAQSRVTGIQLNQNNLVGTLPSLGGLTSLLYFFADNNQLTGLIPSLSGMTALQYFQVNSNQLTGSIPSLSGLTALQNFEVDTNQLTGSIPSLSGLTALRSFHVSNNQLTGSIPPLSGLTSLQGFFVFDNQLTGSIPSLSGLTALKHFWVDRNQLTGSIPSLSGLTALQYFGTGSNQLTGTIPSLGGLTALQEFWVGDNQLTGSIPSLSGLTALQYFAVNVNQLTGSIPSLSGLTALIDARFGNNQLTGSIPSLSGLTALQYIRVHNNQLSGPVPAAPTSLLAGESKLCGNSLVSSGDTSIDAAWTMATGTDWLACQIAATYTLAVTRTGTGTGTITSDTGGIDCGTSCWADYSDGTYVTLTATPASGNYFAGWGGACSGTGSCVIEMDEALSVTATFKPEPFVATTTSVITATSATISTTVTFNAADVGKTGSVYVTSWAPAGSLTALGILSAHTSQAMSVTVTNDDPYSGGEINTRQESLAAVLAAADPNAYVLVQLTSTGWQLVENGQLLPYASGVLGDQMAALSILNNANTSSLLGAQFCVGYGTDAAEMVASGRMMPVADIPGATVATNGSCNVAANPYKGLWYNPAESGWGMSVTQHDTINFVALYTYDQSAQPVWYVMSDCRIATAGSCSGDIYQVTGGTAPTAAWTPNLVLATAGTGTLTFSDTNNAIFDFTLNGVTGSKTIERQPFSSGTAAQALDYTDLWWNANESGWGVALTQDVGMIFATWYTYDAASLPVWYVASSCPLSGSGCTGEVYKVTGGEALTATWNGINPPDPVGTVTFTFATSSTGTMSYTIDGVTGSKSIVRQPF